MSTQKTSKQPQCYVGIDPSARSSGIALCLRTDTETRRFLLTINPPDNLRGGVRLEYIFAHFTAFLIGKGCITITRACIESASHRSTNRETTMSEVRGVFRLVCTIHGHDPRDIAPKQLKKFGAGHGDASKDDIIKAIDQNRWPVSSDDEADASVLCDIAHAMTYHETEKLTRYQLELVYQLLTGPEPKTRLVSSGQQPDM